MKSKAKKVTKFVHWIVFFFQAEEFFLYLRKIHPIFIKFIPLPVYYKNKKAAIVTRNKVVFRLDRNDFMQWSIYSDQIDLSWKTALPFISDKTTIIDVGANCGAFSLPIAKHATLNGIKNFNVLSIEPNPYAIKNLSYNLSLNPKLKDIVTICEFAAGNENDFCSIEFNHNNSGAASVSKKTNSTIPLRRIDDYVKENKVDNITFIKIDIEGWEPEAIKGATQTISKFKPALFIEMTNAWFENHNSSCEEIINLLLKYGYDLFVEVDEVLIQYSKSKGLLSNLFQYNLFAKPQK